MRVRVWDARGSVPTPGPSTNRYGGKASCLQITLSDGTLLVLDAGSGIRNRGPPHASKQPPSPTHSGATLGYRISEGDTSPCYHRGPDIGRNPGTKLRLQFSDVRTKKSSLQDF